MLDWLQKKINRDFLFHELLLISVFFHSALVIMIFFGYQSAPDFTLQVLGDRKEHAIVKVLPLGAIKPLQQKNNYKKNKLGSSTVKEIVKASSDKKKLKNPTTLVSKKEVKKKVQKKNISKDIAPDNKKEAFKNVEVSKGKIKEDSLKDVIVSGTQVIGQSLSSNVGEVKEEKNESEALVDDSILYVTQKEFDVLELQQQLQEAVELVWVCPIGVDKNLVCEVEVMVDNLGVIVSSEFIIKTDVYIYNNAVEEAVEKLALPQSLWGKSIRIIFRP